MRIHLRATLLFLSLLFAAGPAPGYCDSLQAALDARSARSKARVSPETAQIMRRATERLKQSDIVSSAPAKGEALPDGTFTRADGTSATLYGVLGDRPAIVTFYRGGWCPYCSIQLLTYQKHLKDIHALGAELVAISPEKPTAAATTANDNSLAFPVLSDPNNTYARSLGLVFPLPTELQKAYLAAGIDLQKNQGNDLWELPLAATFVINSDKTIVYAFVDADYKKRAEPDKLLTQLQSAAKTH